MITNVLEYLEKAASITPDKVVFGDTEKEITYLECLDVSRRIGTAIAQRGFTKKPIIVLIEKEVESLELFMGCIYSGNFYVPVGKETPKNRIEKIIKDICPPLVLCQKKNLDFFGALEGIEDIGVYEELIQTTADDKALAELRKKHLDTDPLYAIYTSGSTGMPKGVLISHQSVIDLAEQFTDTFHFQEGEIFGNQAPFDFDVSVKDIYCTLKNRATLYIIPTKMFTFPNSLIHFLNEKKVTTIIWAVSAMALSATFKGFEKQKPQYLRKIMFSGEVMPVKVLNYWRKHLPDAMYVNLYGPTEITCNCSYHILDREYSLEEALPLGKPFKNSDVFLLDGDRLVEEEGTLGEICVRGRCLAIGYYHNPEQTQKSFCQNPLQPDYMERIYRTGDLGRYENGELFYVTRKDFQIKHMGHRIELGEIEGVMDQLEYIGRSVCIYDRQGEKIFMFYQSQEPCDERIIHDLRKELPKYMCPNRYVWLSQLPLNKNGKIDRAYLSREYIEGKRLREQP